MEIIATIHTAFPQKFGIPRQSGLVDSLRARITFLPPYNDANAVRGLEEFSHIWLIWGFEGTERSGEAFSPTVRPPRLGGEERVGVFASRSPFRPNALGLSCVRLLSVETGPEGPVLVVAGADLRDGTPIFDIKPYVPLADCRPDAVGGFTETREWERLQVDIPDDLAASLRERLGEEDFAGLVGVLAEDPRPAYQHDAERIYGMAFAGVEVRFTMDDAAGILHVIGA
ncbi:MAG: tRNA (N6-threonylcarbamoyladenosine(37)-N6)-methyltransferase TrmO [Eggerthellaceae bacterium]|nr:tRNA (N6-threonylcarbamoyladenosine(37)-N6)-methyltransferase TrmO [Eggerthellaceae bacterium]